MSATACWKNFPCRFAVWLAESPVFIKGLSTICTLSSACHHVTLVGFLSFQAVSLLVLCQMLFSLQFLLFHTLPDSCFQHIEWILFSYVILLYW